MIEKDTSRVRYLSPEEGVEYGLIDKVLYPQELRVQVREMRMKYPSNYIVLILMLNERRLFNFFVPRRRSSSTSSKTAKFMVSSRARKIFSIPRIV